jgi:ElaB/YqjD/DUF883 family membrane-anchored ribosome-binding protein
MATSTSNTGSPFPTSSSMGESPSSLDTGLDTGTSTGSMSGTDTLGSTGMTADRTLERLVQGAHQAVDSLAAKAGPAVERLKSSMGSAGESMQERADQLSAMQEEWIESARATVREHPLASLAAAVAVGMLISRLTSSR